MEEYYRILFTLLQREKILSYSGRENRITQRIENTVFSESVLVLFSTSPFNGMSPKDLGVLFALSKWHRQMRQAAEVQRQATQWQQEGSAVYARCSLCVPQACAPGIDYIHVVAGNRARGRCSVAVLLTSSIVSMCIVTNRLHGQCVNQQICPENMFFGVERRRI